MTYEENGIENDKTTKRLSDLVLRLRELKTEYGLDRTAFADLLGVDKTSVSHYFNGRNAPGTDAITRLLQNLKEIRADWLLLGEGNMKKNPLTEKDNPYQGILFEQIPKSNSPQQQSTPKKEELHQEAVTPPPKTKLEQPPFPQPFVAEEDPAPYLIDEKDKKTPSSEASLQGVTDALRGWSETIRKEEPRPHRKIVRILVFYNDNSFEELNSTAK